MTPLLQLASKLLVAMPLAFAASICVFVASQLMASCGVFLASSSQHARYAVHAAPSPLPSVPSLGSVGDVPEPNGEGLPVVPELHATTTNATIERERSGSARGAISARGGEAPVVATNRRGRRESPTS